MASPLDGEPVQDSAKRRNPASKGDANMHDLVIREVDALRRQRRAAGAPPTSPSRAIASPRCRRRGRGTAFGRDDPRRPRASRSRPGFIDVHTHDDFAALMYPDMAFKLAGGVTTCVVGNCGFGAAPHAAAAVMAKTLHPNLSLPEWQGYAGYMQRLEAQPPGVNIGVLVGHGTARLAAMGTENRAPTRRRDGGDEGDPRRRAGGGRARAVVRAWSTTRAASLRPTNWSSWRRSCAAPARSTRRTCATRAPGCSTRCARRSRSAGAPACRCRSRTTRPPAGAPGAWSASR